MLGSFEIEGFRGIQQLEVPRLSKINLFVGPNQSGKTSLLDAIQIYLDRGRSETLYDAQVRRNEGFAVGHYKDGSATFAPRLESLFFGAKAEAGRQIALAEPGGPRVILEPRLEGISQIVGEYSQSADTFVLKLAGFDARFGLGDMGEGFRRMFGLLLCLPDEEVTHLLVDENDTGLQHSMLVPMWRTLLAAARRRDLQVFATTHSYDCVAALAALFEEDASIAEDVLVHRIERGYTRTTLYSAEEIEIATRHGIEVRG